MDLDSTDRAAVVRLAALDSSTPLEGPVLGLELDGRLVAAVSLADGASIADPFRRTAEARDLLDLRVKQLASREPPPPWRPPPPAGARRLARRPDRRPPPPRLRTRQ